MIAILIGATGLIGKALLSQLLENDAFSTVKVFHRRPTGVVHTKLKEHIIDFEDVAGWKDQLTGHVLFSTLGTTVKTAGSQQAQYRVDYTYNFEVAQAAAQQGVPTYVLLSSTGADASSRIFYSRMKGELDEAVQQMAFERLRIIRPSVLEGNREEFRLGERMGIIIGKALAWVPGARAYRPIKDTKVAQAMIVSVNDLPEKSLVIYELEEVHKLATQAGS